MKRTMRSFLRLATALPALSFVAAFSLAGCGQDDAPPSSEGPTSPDGGGDEDSVPMNDGLGDGGDTTDDGGGIAADAADGSQTTIPSKIRYVVVLVKENHTFDNYFTGFPGAASSMTAKLSTGATITRPVAPNGPLTQDICHANSCGQRAYHDGAMNQFDLNGAGQLPFIRYTEQQIPNYWQYARNFVLADHLFSTTLGPSTPGHFVFWAGQSMVLANADCTKDGGACNGFGCMAGADVKVTAYNPDTCTTSTVAPCFNVPVLTDHLPKGFTWADYGGPLAAMAKSVVTTPGYASHFHQQGDLVDDISQGKIENLMIGHLWSSNVSEHPSANPCAGENFTVQIVNALMKLPQWNEMAIVITWDDWGGFYDHVAPPVKKCANGQIFQNGFRLPAIIVSPYAKKGFVLSTPTEQASVPRMVEELWGMEFMTTRDPHARDGTAGSLMTAFDFTQAPRAPMPLTTRTCP